VPRNIQSLALDPHGRRTPIVALTADALAGDAERCRAAGMDDYLATPVTAERLEAVVRRWIGGTGAAAAPRAVDPNVLAELRAAGLLEAVVALYVGQAEREQRAGRSQSAGRGGGNPPGTGGDGGAGRGRSGS
jgi:CheY-like chemotaxis protein